MAGSRMRRCAKPLLRSAALSFCLSLAVAAQAQGRQAVIRIVAFSGEGFIASELIGLQNLVAAQIVELRSFRLTDDGGRELALSETEQALALGSAAPASAPVSADYVLTGSLSRVGELVVFSLSNTRVRDGEVLVVSDSAASINDIAARTRTLTRSLFGDAQRDIASVASGGESGPAIVSPGSSSIVSASGGPSVSAGSGGSADLSSSAGAEPAEPKPADESLAAPERAHERPSLAMLAATWRGDKGLETIRLYPNGTGIAFLSGGGTMRVRLSIEGRAIEVWQDQQNDPAMYRSPNWGFDTAQTIAKEARPMRWFFFLSEDGLALFGRKESVAYDGLTRSVDNGYVRDARWERLSR
jgi:hypothetical protein